MKVYTCFTLPTNAVDEYIADGNWMLQCKVTANKSVDKLERIKFTIYRRKFETN